MEICLYFLLEMVLWAKYIVEMLYQDVNISISFRCQIKVDNGDNPAPN